MARMIRSLMSLPVLLSVCGGLYKPQVFRMFHTLVSRGGESLEYRRAVMVDDVEMYHYDSNNRRFVTWTSSLQRIVREQHESIGTEEDRILIKENMFYVMTRRNITRGAHYAQVIYSCEVSEDGRTHGHISVAFDGKDFISFDKNELRWISAVPEAQMLRQKLDNDRYMNEHWKHELENDCLTWMENNYQRSKSIFQRQSRPDVSVSYRRDLAGRALLSCLVTGFYPRPIEVTWTRDGNTVHEVVSSGVLPNHDGTFQIMKQMELETGSMEGQGFSCLVEHSSLQGAMAEPWDGKTERTPAVLASWIIGLIIGTLLLSIVGIVVVILFWKRNKEKHGPSPHLYSRPSSDDSSQASDVQPQGTWSE